VLENGVNVHELSKVRLYEVSVVMAPANAQTSLIAVDDPKSDPEAERYRAYFDAVGMGEPPVTPDRVGAGRD
jgi:hypothetical protein